MRTLHHGYSLIELSITIGLIALLAGSWLTLAASDKDKKNRDHTEQTLDVLEDALRRFVLLHDRMPCPASLSVSNTNANFGLEDNCASGSPTLAGIVPVHNGQADEIWIGTIPTRTLGIKETYMMDGWGRRITYAIHKRSAAISTPSLRTSFGTFAVTNTNHRFDVRDTYGNVHNPTPTSLLRTNPIMYVLVSHGGDRRGSYDKMGTFTNNCNSTNQQSDVENCDYTADATPDSIFLSSDVMDSTIAWQYYYDLIRWRTKSDFGIAAQ